MDALTQSILEKHINQQPSVEGRLVFDRDQSRYLHQGFWAAMYDEIGDLDFTLQSKPQIVDNFLLASLGSQSCPEYSHPSRDEGDFLLKVFVEKVDPFVHLLHKPSFLSELNHFRRGLLGSDTTFEIMLFTIYMLALLPLKPATVETRLHEPKVALMSRYRSYVEYGLSRKNITTSQSLSTLQAFLLYMTHLFWIGEMLHVSTLLGIAVAMARRMGLHRDGSSFPLAPWQVELRRRLWHHIVVLDGWCVENHGLPPLVSLEHVNTALPQNSNDSAWDTSKFASSRPAVVTTFTDMTISLLQSEIGSLTTFTLKHPYTSSMDVRAYLDFQTEILGKARQRLESTYLKCLDRNQVVHRLARDLADLAFTRIRLIQLQPVLNARGCGEQEQAEIAAKLYGMATDYCKTSQFLISAYAPHNLDWAIVRAFSWHSVATMLSMVLRHDSLASTPEARAARSRIEKLFQNRSSIGYLADNDSLWVPLQKLRMELAVKEGTFEAKNLESVSSMDASVDLSHFGWNGEGVSSMFSGWGDDHMPEALR
ncbi:uncharacterized protein A1O9_08756 [Exophiala aquamarina CBS 119918]|uniref:Xylanolytic transcriptional activator regulatory domain-containing protein n=1 Tax=Exophiala aquamarina CBS 119918 TaxID=1182545 RepID=A0A072P746_9EURO|nr:uncharacterized protein A1O9_08756 [Exophiala aquamarina CBS 119918]KEF55103.1 hypothetical protein A1O9_08756 [Exophiala aquamarina CBS 119918]